ncbi:MAG: hypothetical protein HYU36_03745 [Planctomycetes bacterium]|nr:hypothetical protein [Planctomycetota bacterium]
MKLRADWISELLCACTVLAGVPGWAEPHTPELVTKDLPIGGVRTRDRWTFYGGAMYFHRLKMSPDGTALWAATNKGIIRLDVAAERLTRFSTLDGLADNTTLDLTFDASGALWVATFSGLSRLDAQGWKSWRRGDGLRDVHLTHVEVGADEQPWVTTGSGIPATVSHFHGLRWIEYSLLHDGLQGVGIDALHAGSDNRVWAALYDAAQSPGRPGTAQRQGCGLVQFLPDGTWRDVTPPPHLLALNTRRAFTALQNLPDGRLVAGTPLGLFLWNGEKWTRFGFKEGLTDEVVVDLCPGPNQKVWGLTRRGVFSFDGDGVQMESAPIPDLGPLSLRSGKLAVGPEEDFWIAPDPPAVLIHGRGLKWTVHVPELDGPTTPEDRGVRSILKDVSGNLYFACPGNPGALTRFDGTHWEVLLSGELSAAALDRNGSLWVAGGSVFRRAGNEWLNEGKKIGVTGPPSFIHADRQGHLWVGGGKDLLEWDRGGTVPHTGESPGLLPPYLNMATGPAGHLWLWAGQGIFQWKGDRQWSFTGKEGGLPGLKGGAMAVGPRGEVYLGGPWGAAQYDGLTWNHFVREGSDLLEAIPVLPGREVQAILVDRKGMVWFGTADGGIGTFDGRVWGKLTSAQGLPSNGVGCIFEDDEAYWFGTLGGVGRYAKR